MTRRDIRLTLIGKPGCHLCDDAREVVECVREELAATPGARPTTLEERSILDDEALRERYAEEIPVLLIDGEVHGYWRIDPVRLKTALRALD
ncbi:glutaredoxin family protein [Agromyces sp. SYSU T0242]|uniref:glutaredoxin family protein n=1 Tax=Agromyces litoreus TaxID=3158561 RepID=UPI0033946C5C